MSRPKARLAGLASPRRCSGTSCEAEGLYLAAWRCLEAGYRRRVALNARRLSGYFVLRGNLDIRDLICLSPQSGDGGGPDGVMVANHSLGYRGELLVVAVPRGSTWSLTISDVENPRAPPPTPGWAPNGAFGDYPSSVSAAASVHGEGRIVSLGSQRNSAPRSACAMCKCACGVYLPTSNGRGRQTRLPAW
jgi:hypothetical protein